MRILIVDDAVESRRLIRSYLYEAGYRDICEAENAEECYQILGDSGKGKAPPVDLIIMDILMPGTDGITALIRIKRRPESVGIPVLVVTSDLSIGKLDTAFSYGASDYMTKPLKRVELLARVRAALKLKEQTDRLREREKELQQAAAALAGMNRKLKRMSELDGLTGIANRRHFDDFLANACRELPHRNEPLSIIMLDVDCFKAYNDAYGHIQGDVALRTLARAIADFTKPQHLCGRYGGEEFAIVAPGMSEAEAMDQGKRLCQAVEDLAILHEQSPVASVVTVSIGVVTILPEEAVAVTPAELLICADQGLYHSKQTGRNRVSFVAFHKKPNIVG